MNYLDIILIVPLAWFAYKGFKNGLIREAASVAALLLGIYGAIRFSNFASSLILEYSSWESPYLPIISFAITFILIVIAVHFIARLVDKLVKAVALGIINRIAGGLFGIVKILLLLSTLLYILNRFGNHFSVIPAEVKENSLLYDPISSISIQLFPTLDSIDLSGITDKIDLDSIPGKF